MSALEESVTPAPETSPPDLIGSGQEGNLRDQVTAYLQRLRNGDMGALPAIAGFIVLSILFTLLSPYFLTERNFANLLTQAATLVMLAMALVFVILLGEIDLSAGVTSGVAMSLFVVLSDPGGLAMNWIVALIVALVAGVIIGLFIGFFVARVGIPSFVVTLGLFLGFQGVQLIIIGNGGLYRIQQAEILAIQNSNLPTWGGWVMLAIMLLVSAGTSYFDRRRRTRAGVPNRTIALVWARLIAIAVAGGVVVALLNQDRGTGFLAVSGVPIVVPITLAILWLGTFVLDRTRFGRYIYAIGGNAEAARRAGVKVIAIKWAAFAVCSTLAVVSGVFSASKVGSVDAAFGRDIVLSGIAAAVVGGVSLFGGRGRLIHAAIGALVIAVITNGLGLLNLPGGVNFLVTGGVLILAATVDALSRRRAGGSLIRQ
ncbi:sugar ABC transporter permease [Leifsonia poae]|uniref:Xylose transport system permease protein XylH n=1 Tax=Leifsonia poae TaxID=110933 RepID=A0A9W6H913_9MICO|nr:ABC transporter permease [Leifsonia poae]GLJ76145.1 ABC transporter permease [Leifsonia poae]